MNLKIIINLQVVFGPSIPSIYRLQGQGTWSGARKAIMAADERVLYPLATRKINTAEGSGLLKLLFIMLVISGIAWLVGIF